MKLHSAPPETVQRSVDCEPIRKRRINTTPEFCGTKMTEVYESYSELKVNGRELLLVDNDGYTYKKARGNSGAKVYSAILCHFRQFNCCENGKYFD
jgi:hypothetical protein